MSDFWFQVGVLCAALVALLAVLGRALAWLHGRAERSDVIVRTRPVFTPGLIDDD